jgi:hypothetical protein
MKWTTPADLESEVNRLWQRGELLRPLVTGENEFPRRLALRTPAPSELSSQFEAVRTWAAELATAPCVRIEWREVRHRTHGAQRLPAQVWVDTLDDALRLVSKSTDAARFTRVVEMTRAELPALLPWLARQPLLALEMADRWQHLMAIVRWLTQHPRPGVYLRQVDVAGVHSKFIERHRIILSELLDLALPPDAIRPEFTGSGSFADRYGFLDKPVRLRFRILDERIPLISGAAFPDVTLDATSFAALTLPVRQVFITENETNFLSFPSASESIVVFGAGYGWDALSRAEWLTRCIVHYWGDIDTHGFAILDQLRARFDHVASFLMDRDTLMAHEAHWNHEQDPARHDLPRLTASESALYDELRDNRIRENLRLEQERIGYHWLTGALDRLPQAARPAGDSGA